ncbi:MAG: 1,4-alpha-glucan branching protein GlgB [Chloroflexota bacterium]
MNCSVSKGDVEAICTARHGAPFDVLGVHPVDCNGKTWIAIRAFLPYADSVTVIPKGRGKSQKMALVHSDGFFEAVFKRRKYVFAYTLRVTTKDGVTLDIEDPYRFSPVISDYDLYLLGEGTNLRLYEHMGSHLCKMDGVEGVSFAVWAPDAERVSVVGLFNQWDGRCHSMRPRGSSGIWELFIPQLKEWEIYKYEIRSRHGGYTVTKSDPIAFASELRPKTASLVFDQDRYSWNDQQWMEDRSDTNKLEAPLSIYEVHLGSWQRDSKGEWLTYRELADDLVPYVKNMGFTHIELLPVTEHPFDGSWGYQTIGYFSPTSRFGTPDDFKYLVDQCHQNGIGVILDWVPAHFPKDETGLAFFDGTHLYEHADPRKGEHPDWGTLIFNYDRSEVQEFLLASALFWLDKYHIDGLRVDAVASMLYLDYSRKEGEWIPNEYGGRENLGALAFLKRLNEVVHLEYPSAITCAEESTAWPMVSRPTYLGGLGFDYKWNMGWMHDTLAYIEKDPIYRKYHHNSLTFSLIYAFNENFILPLSHDEVVHMKGSLLGKMPGDEWQRFANLRALYAYMYAHPGKKLVFMGGEFGQYSEWNHDSSLDWHLTENKDSRHRGLANLVKDLNQLYKSLPALYEIDFDWAGFDWIDYADHDRSIVSFQRKSSTEENVIVVSNFTPTTYNYFRLGVPASGTYRAILNSDEGKYGGSGVGIPESIEATDQACNDHKYSIDFALPPLAVVYFVQTGDKEQSR